MISDYMRHKQPNWIRLRERFRFSTGTAPVPFVSESRIAVRMQVILAEAGANPEGHVAQELEAFYRLIQPVRL